MSHSDLDSRKIDLFLYASIPFVIVYQFVVQPDRLNYGTIRTFFKGAYEITRGH